MIDSAAIDLDFAEPITLDFEDAPFTAPAHVERFRRIVDVPAPLPRSKNFALRDYQHDCLRAIVDGRSECGRILAVLATGCGKTIIFSQVTAAEVEHGGRVLILAHTEELLDQAATKLERSTGVVSEREKAENHAGMNARVVIASVQTLARESRLTAFPDNHFSLVIVDEAHRSLAASYQKILRYFHFGAASLEPDWKMPAPEVAYECKAQILGVTATADRGDKRSLGEFYQKIVFDYGLLQACRDGYLVRPISVQVPLKIDLKGVKVSRSAGGSDFDVSELTQRITPFLREIARHIIEQAGDRKVVNFLPGVETARLLSEALTEQGMPCKFVSGACNDRSEKLEWFNQAGPGNAICNAMLLTEGWDCPDVSAVCVLRPTKIRALYVQCVGRGTRILPGVIDGIATRGERIAAIAASAKPDLRILDFLWLSDRLDLVKPNDLVAETPQIKAAMDKRSDGKGGDLIELVEAADRDLLKSLEKAAKAHAKKEARVIDPLAWAVSLGDAALAEYEPETAWETRPPTPGQMELLHRNKIDTSKVTCFGHASKIIDRIVARGKLGLASIGQLSFLKQLGVHDLDAAILSVEDARLKIEATLAAKRARRDALK